MKRFLAIAALLVGLTACTDATKVTPAQYTDMRGWNDDHLMQPFLMFRDSCHANENRESAYLSHNEGPVGVRANWQRACTAADAMEAPTEAGARQFFEGFFAPYKVETEQHSQGLITGYYEPILRGSKVRKPPFTVPVYGVPKDLGERKPYYTRAEIVAGALRGKAPVLLYTDDPVKLFFLHVQGSGKVRLPKGKMVGLQYAGQNGYSYTPIGRILRDRGELTELSMQAIRDWLLSHPSQMNEVMNQNESYIFFKMGPGDRPAKGALGLPLTPMRSIAVDDDRAAYGVPTYLDTTQSRYRTGEQIPLRRLFISQDTGGALHGPHRADVFYGQGDVEEWQAGHQNSRANVYWLLPLAPPPPRTPVLDAPALTPAAGGPVSLDDVMAPAETPSEPSPEQ
jgi:membrane-bound lytic murein transglycosylase A